MEHELEGVSSLILHFEAVRMNADEFHLSRLSNRPMESLNRIAKDLKKNEISFRKTGDSNIESPAVFCYSFFSQIVFHRLR